MSSDKPDPGFGALAYVAAGLAIAASRIIAWVVFEPGPWLAGIFDAGQFLAVSFVLAFASDITSRFDGRYFRGRLGWVPWVALVLAAALVGHFALLDDLDNFSRRQTALPQGLVQFAAVFALSQTLVVAVLLGRLFDRPKLRWVVLAAAVAAATLNGLVLPNDYVGLHLLLACCALLAAGTALRSAKGLPARPRAKPLLLVGLVCSLLSPLVPIPANLSTALHNSTGAAFSGMFAWHRRASLLGPGADVTLDPEWFSPRDDHPPVAPHHGELLGKRPVVVLITVDALRADVVYSGKYDGEIPTLARLRDEGVVFTQARAAGTLTKTSLSSLFMGKHFSQQYWSPMKRFNNAMSVHEDESVRFTEILSEAKVHTATYRAVSWLRNGVVMRGFDHQEHVQYPAGKSYYTPSPPVFKKLMPHVRKSSKRERGAFIYSHLADPHAPYDQGKKKKGSPFERYLSEVSLVDSQLEKLVRILTKMDDENGRRVLLIVSADHGEAFGEHNSQTHGTTLYDEGLHVPLIFWSPGLAAAQVETPVSLLDIGPTVLDLFGLKTPGSYMGQSLAPYLAGEQTALTRPIIAETRLMRTLVTPDLVKVIVDTRSNRIELYDLKLDPDEAQNLADDHEKLGGPLNALTAFFDAHTLRRDGYRPPYIR